MKSYDILLKTMILGTSNVGKTQMIEYFRNNEFRENSFPTAGVDFAITIFKSHNKVVKCQIWDTGGNKQFIGTIQHYEIGVNIFFVLFDITARRTFDEVDYCYNNAISEKGKNMLMYLIGNKSDLEDKREVTVKEAQIKANIFNMRYVEMTNKDRNRIDEIFQLAIDDYLSINENKVIINLKDKRKIIRNYCF